MSGFKFEDLYEEGLDDRSVIELQKKLHSIGESARACLNTGVFVNYKEQFEKAYDNILDAMIKYTNDFCADPNGNVSLYALKMARYVQKIQDLKILIKQVEVDSLKGAVPEKE